MKKLKNKILLFLLKFLKICNKFILKKIFQIQNNLTLSYPYNQKFKPINLQYPLQLKQKLYNTQTILNQLQQSYNYLSPNPNYEDIQIQMFIISNNLNDNEII